MPKKNIILGLSFLLIVTGCSGKPVDMSYEQTYNTFATGLFNSTIFDISKVLDKTYVSEDLDLNIDGDDSSMQTNISFNMQSKTNINTTDSESSAKFDVNIIDKIKREPMVATGSLEVRHVNNNIFVKINDLNMNAGEGNAMGNLIGLMIGSFKSKRIWMDQDFGNVKRMDTSKVVSTYSLPKTVMNLLSKYVVLSDKGKTTYDKKIAYNVDFDKQQMSGFISDLQKESIFGNSGLSLDTMDFSGVLVIQSQDKVDLVIKKLVINGETPITITGVIGNMHGEINAFNELANERISFTRGQRRKYMVLGLSFVSSEGIVTSINLDILPSIIESGMNFEFNGKLKAPFTQITTDSTSELNIEGNYKIREDVMTYFYKPDTYLSLSQLLGDQYSLNQTMDNLVLTGSDMILTGNNSLTGFLGSGIQE